VITFEGQFQDGQSSASMPVRITAWPELNRVVLQGVGIEQNYTLEQLDFSVRVGNIPRRIIFPNGASFETLDNASVDALYSANKVYPSEHWIHLLESRFVWVFVSLAITAVAMWSLVAFGIPWLAEKTSSAIPNNLETQLGEQTLEGLDNLIFSPSKLKVQQKNRGKGLMDDLLAGHNDIGFKRLEFRAMKDNTANAMALPSGIIVVTDRLMELADKDEELQAVLAHELGHVYYRHLLRSWLQNSAVALFVAGILGDVSSISANVAVLPTLLVENHYSHEFEEQADDFAIILLNEKKIDTCHIGLILSKLESSLPDEAKSIPDFLSTHPATDKRIERVNVFKQGKVNSALNCPSKL
jgi:Zn-dependent protease with chaperone function